MRAKVFVPLLVAAWTLPLAANAFAVVTTVQYPNVWGTVGAEDRKPQWRFDDNFPTGAIRSRVIDGAHVWNNENRSLKYDHVPGDYTTFGWDESCSTIGYQEDKVGWGDLDPGVRDESAAEYKTCFAGTGTIQNFRIKFSNDRVWYTGNASAPNGEADAMALAAHEFGHTAGAKHYAESSANCPSPPSSSRSTMCHIVYSPGGRTLSAQDKRDFNAVY